MGQDTVIDIQNISKCYRRYHHPIDRLKELIVPRRPRGEEFWALRDISLQIQRGESLGILGQNGSGKSTLLQIIAKTLTPSNGSVAVTGRVSALLELGSGFNPEFTGRQNAILNGRILGFSQKQIEAKLDEIIDFSEIGDFVDQPVHTYSSGMFVRLAFAAAVVWEPEILIVDEALAVGDIFFQQKCFDRIKALHERGVTLLFVSHDTRSMLTLCSRAAVLDHGKLLYLGDTARAVEQYQENYYRQMGKAPEVRVESSPEKTAVSTVPLGTDFVTHFSETGRHGQHMGLIEGIRLEDGLGRARPYFCHDDDLTLLVKLGAYPPELAPLNVGFQLRDRLGQIIVGTNTKMLGQDLVDRTQGEGFICKFRFKLSLAPGDYSLSVAVAENELHVQSVYDYINGAIALSLVASGRDNEQGGLYWPTIAVSTLTPADL